MSPLTSPAARTATIPDTSATGAASVPLRAAVITCSDSAAAGSAADTSGPLAAQLLTSLGHAVDPVEVVPDQVDTIGAAVRSAISRGARIVVTTGGTGGGPRDVTPEALASLGLRELPGLGEAIRAASRATVPATDLSRSVGGVLAGAVVLALPGSNGGVRDGLAAVGGLLAHAAAMAQGGGHEGDGRARRAPDTSGAAHAHHDEAHHPQPDDAPHAPAHQNHAPLTATAAASAPIAAPEVLVRSTPLTEAEVTHEVASAASGAVVTFAGVVRDHDGGRSVTDLHYEGHPDAGRILAEVVAQAQGRPGVLGAAARHRVGDLTIGDLAFVVAVSSAHRAAAFETCAWLVDEAKARLPIWKHQRFADGSDEWVNCP